MKEPVQLEHLHHIYEDELYLMDFFSSKYNRILGAEVIIYMLLPMVNCLSLQFWFPMLLILYSHLLYFPLKSYLSPWFFQQVFLNLHLLLIRFFCQNFILCFLDTLKIFNFIVLLYQAKTKQNYFILANNYLQYLSKLN